MTKYILGDLFIGDYPITQYYGNNVDYYRNISNGSLTLGHEGVDWGCPLGTSVVAPFDGVILRDVDDFKSGAYGNFVVIWDPLQLCAVWYCHLSENFVNHGDSVKKGQIIGKTGNSGNTSGPHLHVNFVETDSTGNRLNTSNGNLGFLNILDPQIVEWELGNAQPTTPPPVPFFSEDEKNALAQVVATKEESDKLKEGNLEGAARAMREALNKIDAVYQDGNNARQEVINLTAEKEQLTEVIRDLEQKIEELAKQLTECQNTKSVEPVEAPVVDNNEKDDIITVSVSNNRLLELLHKIITFFKGLTK